MRYWRVAAWTASIASLVGGFWIGMWVHPQTGAALWIAAAVLALAPFASHRTQP